MSALALARALVCVSVSVYEQHAPHILIILASTEVPRFGYQRKSGFYQESIVWRYGSGYIRSSVAHYYKRARQPMWQYFCCVRMPLYSQPVYYSTLLSVHFMWTRALAQKHFWLLLLFVLLAAHKTFAKSYYAILSCIQALQVQVYFVKLAGSGAATNVGLC